MAGIDNTKMQLLRGAVQDNIDTVQGVRTRRAAKRRINIKYFLWAGIVLAGAAYLAIPAQVVSRNDLPTGSGLPSSANLGQISLNQTLDSAETLATPRPLDKRAIPMAVKRIVIDPGHGGEPGAMSDSGIVEKDITLDIALRLQRLLKTAPFEVLLTRDSDRLVPLDRRVAMANENKADLFISIHVNSMVQQSVRALETYYVGPTDDPEILKLTSRENRGSGYALSDYKKILEKIYVDARHDESRSLAKTVQGLLFQALKPHNQSLENRGVKTAPFAVLIGTQMPAILVEVGCLSNADEVKLLTNDDYRENIAKALVQSIRSYANNFNAPERKGS